MTFAQQIVTKGFSFFEGVTNENEVRQTFIKGNVLVNIYYLTEKRDIVLKVTTQVREMHKFNTLCEIEKLCEIVNQ